MPAYIKGSGRIVRLVVSLALPFGAGALGGWATSQGVGDWYLTLAKPSFNPPSWVFGPAWTLLYILMGLAFFLVWDKGATDPEGRRGEGPAGARGGGLVGAHGERPGGARYDALLGVRGAMALFGVQLALNSLWSFLFFWAQAPGWAFAEILLLWVAIAGTMVLFFRQRRLAGWLMTPYLGWVTFAAVLNYSIWTLNT
jgi:tryptophan-rich sensory protein